MGRRWAAQDVGVLWCAGGGAGLPDSAVICVGICAVGCAGWPARVCSPSG
ncbi:hypothetical protein RchiOBHm_Chr4g0392331 [Rosa chinensis]|uniref:Uncharacterized protein n=1 Tax=Rosa chinensis TaxID=74649 RepID=A0A2P6QQP7_ROSCH|nr:hypothetical protein RchiOBHm_Chr4g0392331 [Rosa chinensis]